MQGEEVPSGSADNDAHAGLVVHQRRKRSKRAKPPKAPRRGYLIRSQS